MSDDESSIHSPEPPEPQAPAIPPQASTARIRTLHRGVQMKGFTLSAGQIVSGVSLAMARHLESSGQIQIIDISNAS